MQSTSTLSSGSSRPAPSPPSSHSYTRQDTITPHLKEYCFFSLASCYRGCGSAFIFCDSGSGGFSQCGFGASFPKLQCVSKLIFFYGTEYVTKSLHWLMGTDNRVSASIFNTKLLTISKHFSSFFSFNFFLLDLDPHSECGSWFGKEIKCGSGSTVLRDTQPVRFRSAPGQLKNAISATLLVHLVGQTCTQAELKQPPSQQPEETLYAEPILVNQSKPNPLGRIYSPIGKLSGNPLRHI